MAKENLIRKKAVDILEKDGWITWVPPRIKYYQTDVFGIIDVLAWRGNKQKNIQLTTLPNVSAKRKKIINFLKKHKIEHPVEIWSWDNRRKRFKKEKIKIKIKKA